MKKILCTVVIGILLAGLTATAASAQMTTNTSFQVQNLSGSPANVNIAFYDSSGNQVVAANVSDTIPGNDSTLYTQSNNASLPTGFNGSVVVSSDQPVAAIGIQEAKNAASTLYYQGTYSGFSAGATTFYLPVIMDSFYGYTTEVSIQNAGSSNVDVTINYTGGYSDSTTGLKPGAAHRFDNGSTVGIPANYIGAGTVTATGPVVAVVNQNHPTNQEQQTYNGFSTADAAGTLYVPNLMRGFYNFNTSVQVQNLDSSAQTVTIHFENGTSQTSPSLAQGASHLFTQENNTALPASWIGSAYLTSSGGGNIIAVVNQQNTGTGKASSYNAFAVTGTRFVAPNVMRAFYGFNTSVQVMNIGAAASTFTISFPGQAAATQTTPSALAQYETYLFTQQNNGSLPMNWNGAAEITSASGTQQFVVIVNQEGPSGVGDTMMSYNAIAAP
ncbi:MAG: hypothetical protein ACFFA6_13335 [Promethearchaeota archaeon]